MLYLVFGVLDSYGSEFKLSPLSCDTVCFGRVQMATPSMEVTCFSKVFVYVYQTVWYHTGGVKCWHLMLFSDI